MMNNMEGQSNYHLLTKWFGEWGMTVLDITFAYCRYNLMTRHDSEFIMEEDQLSGTQADSFIKMAIEIAKTAYDRVKDLDMNTMNKWKNAAKSKLTEVFRWVAPVDMAKMFTDHRKGIPMESIVPEVFRGKYGLGFHRAAIKVYIQDIVDCSVTIPFFYNVEAFEYKGFTCNRIVDV